MQQEKTLIPVPGIPGWYACASGKIWSEKAGRLLAGRTLKTGYVQVGTEINGKLKLYREHILICTAFHGKPKGLKNTVNHINNIRNDNRPENLEWLSIQDNIRHSVLQNRRLRKLSPEIVQQIRSQWIPRDRKCSTRVLAKKYGLHHSYILALCNHQYNQHIL